MSETPADAATDGEHVFQAEVTRLLHLMVHAVYSNKDIFLRELISNGADACEKLRYMAVQDASLLGDNPDLAIRLKVDDKAGTLTVTDNGIGMDDTDLIENLGTIAHSGTRAFLDNLDQANDGSALIGQFGIGFYSAFMVADTVDVYSTKAGGGQAWHWHSDGSGTFTVTPIEGSASDGADGRGTRVVLNLREDSKSFADEATVERIVREYSAHVPVPIILETTDEETEAADSRQLADGSALWTRSKSEISEDEYKEFYGHVSGQFDEPALTIHYRAEGRQEYSVLAFVPTMKPFDLFDPDRKGRVRLYVRRVFISDEVNLLPAWLRFVRGLVDSEDLPLNMSRELLQSSPMLEAITKGVTNRVLSELSKQAEKDPEAYATFWDNFGAVLKEGLYEDMERRDTLFELARFKTSSGGDNWRTLKDYIADLKDNQTAIHYLLADTLEAANSSPHLEGFKARGVEVLLLTDPVDAFWVQTAIGFDGKPFSSITQGAADLDNIAAESDDDTDDKVADADLATLITQLKQSLGDQVSDVRASTRLAESPVCLVAADMGPDRQLEKLMSRSQGAGPGSAPVLEINPKHALVRRLSEIATEAQSDVMEDAAALLFGQARIAEGETPEDTVGFARAMARMMEQALA